MQEEKLLIFSPIDGVILIDVSDFDLYDDAVILERGIGSDADFNDNVVSKINLLLES